MRGMKRKAQKLFAFTIAAAALVLVFFPDGARSTARASGKLMEMLPEEGVDIVDTSESWPNSSYSAFNYKSPGKVWESDKSMGAGEYYPGIDKNADSEVVSTQGVSGPQTNLTFGYPVENPYVTSYFGWRKTYGRIHYGIDFRGTTTTPILAAERGTLTWYTSQKDNGNGFGIVAEINHGDGFSTLYAHCSTLLVKEGDHVQKGDVIGYVGGSGGVPVHLHFEIRRKGIPYNPFLGYLTAP